MAKTNTKPAAKQKKNNTAKPKQSDASSSSRADSPDIPPDLQQKCLDIFRHALHQSLDDEQNALLQEVKGHLYNRDFAAAFSKEEYLRVYASRWSPIRALAYLSIFRDVEAFLEAAPASSMADGRALRVTCLGGGAGGELVALAAWWCLQRVGTGYDNLDVTLVDIAGWASVTTSLTEGITTAPALSNFASQARKDANRPLLTNDVFSTTFHQLDVLDPKAVNPLLSSFADAKLVTFCFILNELYSTSLPRTQALLATLTATMPPGSCVLVVDSPGSYSSVAFNSAPADDEGEERKERKYPMHWLLDHTLLGLPSDTPRGQDAAGRKWEKLLEDSSRWFRLPRELRYPIELEDMRVQIHLYRRLGDRG